MAAAAAEAAQSKLTARGTEVLRLQVRGRLGAGEGGTDDCQHCLLLTTLYALPPCPQAALKALREEHERAQSALFEALAGHEDEVCVGGSGQGGPTPFSSGSSLLRLTLPPLDHPPPLLPSSSYPAPSPSSAGGWAAA